MWLAIGCQLASRGSRNIQTAASKIMPQASRTLPSLINGIFDLWLFIGKYYSKHQIGHGEGK
jgi:hypothetical protein